MTDCFEIQNQLTNAQEELSVIQIQLADPKSACEDEGYDPGSDACILFIKSLHDRSGELQTTIGVLQSFQNLCQLLVGSWTVTQRLPSGQVLTGQLTIDNLDVTTVQVATFSGSLVLGNDPQVYTLQNASYLASRDAPIYFRRILANGIDELWTAGLDINTPPPTMYDGNTSSGASWSAVKQG